MESQPDRKLHLLLDHPRYVEDLESILESIPEPVRIHVSGRIARMVTMAIDHGLKLERVGKS
jgi:hypothetical protein